MNVSFFLSWISVCFFAVAALFLCPSDVQAEFFKYKDSTGNLVITNKLENVPKKYRKSVKVVWDDELTAKDPYARRMAAEEARHEEQHRQKAQQQQEKKGAPGKLQPSEGKMLVYTLDEETGQLIRTME